MPDLTTNAENTWCPGCGNFGIFNAFKKAVRILEAKGVGRDRICVTAGIGCHGKILDYLMLSGFYSIHGRAPATAQGIKLARPELKVVSFVGDGDALGEGIGHLVFAAKRNADITVIVHDNGVYGLTTGQYAPTSRKGFRGPSTPQGSVEEPLNPIALMLEAGATFCARGYSARIDHLAGLMAMAIEHKGFSFLDVLQPCVSYNDTYRDYNQSVTELDAALTSREAAVKAARMNDRIPIGLFFREEKTAHHEAVLAGRNLAADRINRSERQKIVNELIKE